MLNDIEKKNLHLVKEAMDGILVRHDEGCSLCAVTRKRFAEHDELALERIAQDDGRLLRHQLR